MAVNVGDLEATIRLLDELSPALKKTEDNVKGFSAKSSVLMGLFQGAGMAAFQMVSRAAVTMAREVPLALFEAGAAAEESENLFAVSFGSMADSAREWSVELAKATGQNEYELRKNSATLFVMMESMGVATDQAYNMSTALTGLAGDLASFYDLPHEEAFGKIQAGISGEAEPLKRLGILVLESTVKQAALTHGLIRQGEVMDEQTKVMARYHAIMDQTVKAQGDLARTIDSPTNAVRALTAQWEALQIHLGQALMPAFQAVIKLMGVVLTGIMDNRDALQEWVRTGAIAFVNMLPVMVKGIQFLNTALSAVIVGYRSFRHGILKTVEAVIKASMAWANLKGDYEEFGQLQVKLNEVQEDIASNATKAGESIDSWTARDQALQGLAETASNIAAGFEKSQKEGKKAAKATKELDGAGKSLGITFDKFLEVTQPVVGELVPGLAQMARDAERMAAAMPSGFEVLANAIKGATQGVVDPLSGLIRKQLKTLAAETPGMFSIPLKAGLGQAMEDLPGVILGAIQGGGDVLKAVGASLGGTIAGSLGKGITDKLTPMLGENLAKGLGSLAGPLGSVIGSLAGSLIGKLGGLFGGDKVIMEVNDMRDSFFEAQGGFEEFSRSMAAVSDEDWAKKIFDATTVEEFNALVEESQALLDGPAQAWEKTKEAADRYGLTLEELGPAFAEQQLHEQAGQLLQDFRLLEASGADMSAVMAKMGPDMSTFVQQSVAAGVAIPQAMEPMIDQMIAAGELLDANGDAYTSAEDAGITYAQTMDEMFTSLIDKIDQMVNALLGINDVNVSPSVNIPGAPHRDDSYYNNPPKNYQQGFYSPSMPAGQGHDGGTNLRVHEGEEVSVTPASLTDSGGDQPLQVVVHIGPEKLYDMITKASKTGQVRVYPDAVKAF